MTRNASAPAAREAASSSLRPETPMIAMRPAGPCSARMRLIASIFVYGGELNAAIIKSRLPHGVSLQAAQSLEPADSQA